MSESSDAGQKEQTYSLSEVAEGLGIPTYRLRSWENFYPVFKSVRSESGQPCYKENDVAVIRRIADLLYKEGRKSHEIMPILREELGHITNEVNFRPGDKAQLTEELAKENEQLRKEINGLQQKLADIKEHQETVETELSGTVSFLGQENARLQAKINECEKNQEKLREAEQQIMTLKDDLGYAHEVHVHDEEKLARYQGIEAENERLKQEVDNLVANQAQKRAIAQDQEIERLHQGFKMIVTELDRLKKLFISV